MFFRQYKASCDFNSTTQCMCEQSLNISARCRRYHCESELKLEQNERLFVDENEKMKIGMTSE